MKSHKGIASILLLLLATIAPTASNALVVTISAGDGTTPIVLESTGPTVNLDCPVEPANTAICPSTTLGSARTYDFGNGVKFTISRCGGTGCTGGRARVTVSDGAVDTLVLTDAVIRNAGTTTATLMIRMDSGAYTAAGEAGPRSYAVELSGLFLPTAINAANNVRVTARACYVVSDFDGGSFIECFSEGSGARMIDSPALDPGEESESQFSISAPPYKPAGTSQFSPKEQDSENCPEFGDTCIPALRTDAEIRLAAGYSLRVPGSIGAAGTKDICDPSTPDDPARQRGCIAMASYFASLGPKGAEMYQASLEPSPGFEFSINLRGVWNSSDRWVTKRDGGTNDDSGVVGASQTKVELETNGSGELTAKGLCSANYGCEATALPVRVYCNNQGNNQVVFTTALNLNNRGDGRADLISTLPCPDPAVLIMDPSNSEWVAAPMVF